MSKVQETKKLLEAKMRQSALPVPISRLNKPKITNSTPEEKYKIKPNIRREVKNPKLKKMPSKSLSSDNIRCVVGLKELPANQVSVVQLLPKKIEENPKKIATIGHRKSLSNIQKKPIVQPPELSVSASNLKADSSFKRMGDVRRTFLVKKEKKFASEGDIFNEEKSRKDTIFYSSRNVEESKEEEAFYQTANEASGKKKIDDETISLCDSIFSVAPEEKCEENKSNISKKLMTLSEQNNCSRKLFGSKKNKFASKVNKLVKKEYGLVLKSFERLSLKCNKISELLK